MPGTETPTQYDYVIPAQVRRHVEDLMGSWRADGRPDDRIEHIVRSVALAALASERSRAEQLEGENQRLREFVAEVLRHDEHHFGAWTLGMRARARVLASVKEPQE